MKLSPLVVEAAAILVLLCSPASADGPPDIVRTKDGGMLRGTIEELVPGKRVVIVLSSGERRTVDGAELEYAGPVDKDPKVARQREEPPRSRNDGDASRPFATVSTETAEVSFTSDQPDATVYVKTSEAKRGTAAATGFTLLCTVPCKAKLPAGSHVLGVSRGGSKVGEGKPVTLPPGSSHLFVRFEDASGTRTGGYVLWYGGLLAGAAVMFSSKESTVIGVGAAIAFGSSLGGFVMVSQEDGATLRTQTAVRVSPTVAWGERADGSRPMLPAFSVTGRF